jgi:RNA polymerase sigma-70 factor, ECF subfamily
VTRRSRDAELVARYQEGDADAFTEIYQSYAPLLRRYLYRRCRDWEHAEDLVQEAMLKAARYIPHGQIYDLNGYLTLCALQRWRLRCAQGRAYAADEPFDPETPYPGSVGSVESLVAERETVREVSALLDLLPEVERDVARLKVFVGHDLASAGEVLGIGRSAASSAWRRSTRKLSGWAGTKTGRAALDQAIILSRSPTTTTPEEQCRVPGCARPRYAHGRCQYHHDAMLARRRQLAAKRGD